jgi:hypothetical protein
MYTFPCKRRGTCSIGCAWLATLLCNHVHSHIDNCTIIRLRLELCNFELSLRSCLATCWLKAPIPAAKTPMGAGHHGAKSVQQRCMDRQSCRVQKRSSVKSLTFSIYGWADCRNPEVNLTMSSRSFQWVGREVREVPAVFSMRICFVSILGWADSLRVQKWTHNPLPYICSAVCRGEPPKWNRKNQKNGFFFFNFELFFAKIGIQPIFRLAARLNL